VSKTLTIEFVVAEMAKKGWAVKNTEYKGSQKALEVICSKGHETTITWNNFQRGQGCRFCVGNFKYSYEEVFDSFAKEGCQLLSKKYINNLDPLDFICHCGKRGKTSYYNFKEGSRCRSCANKKISKALTVPSEKITAFVESNGCELIEIFHKQTGNKKRKHIRYICKCGKEASAIYSNFIRFPNCWKCGNAKKSGSNSYRCNPNRNEILSRKTFRKLCERLIIRTLQSSKKTKTNKLLGYSPEQLRLRIEEMIVSGGLQGKSIHIDHYFPVSAFLEYEIYDPKLINALDNLRPLEKIDNLEKHDKYNPEEFLKWLQSKGCVPSKIESLTVWLDSLKVNYQIINNIIDVGEFGIHYFELSKTTEERQQTHRLYRNFGKPLITIFSDEWMKRNTQCKNYLKSRLNISSNKIFARKCQIEAITKDEACLFFETYHIQGKNNTGIVFFGLFYENEMVGAISLGRHTRQYDDLVLDRLCFKDGYQITGGASKLFKTSAEWARRNGYTEVLSFSDNRWSTGRVYEKLGFNFDKDTGPDYSYINSIFPSKRLSKQSQRKKVVKCPEGMTEHEWAAKRHLLRIWDCGKKRWLFRL
jgi:GNAT superfamily N-acetyltransferase